MGERGQRSDGVVGIELLVPAAAEPELDYRLRRRVAALIGDDVVIRRLPGRRKSTLLVVANEKRSVIAKTADPDTLEREWFVYGSLLPQLGLPGPSVIEWCEIDGERWLVVDLIDGRPADLSSVNDKRSVAELLARLHARSRAVGDLPSPLPGRLTPSERLGLIQAAAPECHEGPDQVAWVLGACNRLRSLLPSIIEVAHSIPAVYCHGDVAGQNLLIVGSEAVAVDWERSGVTSPAADIAYIDLDAYHTALGHELGVEAPNREALGPVARAGKILSDLDHRLEAKRPKRQRRYLERMLRTAEELVSNTDGEVAS
jgi:hypothetical protein